MQKTDCDTLQKKTQFHTISQTLHSLSRSLLVENVDTIISNNLIYWGHNNLLTYEHSVLYFYLVVPCLYLVFTFVPGQAKLAAGQGLNGKANASSQNCKYQRPKDSHFETVGSFKWILETVWSTSWIKFH